VGLRQDDVVQVADGVSWVRTPARRGPSPCRTFCPHGAQQARAALGELAGLDADVVLPGHGRPHRGPVRDAVQRAQDR
jgi:glyoxylase-like metal-dependent hydrolase (beta-lactamase superfamily II)